MNLDDFSREGEFHSSGKFTTDSHQALEKLKNWLLQPEDCLLYLVQAAVASGASWAKVEINGAEVRFEQNGFFPNRAESEQLLDWALQSRDVSRHRWGVALASTLAPPGRGLSLDFSEGPSLQISPRGKRVTMIEAENDSPLLAGSSGRLRISWPVSWWRSWFKARLPGCVSRLLKRARFAPLSLKVCGETVLDREFGSESWVGKKVPLGDKDESFLSVHHHVVEVRLPADGGPAGCFELTSNSSASYLEKPDSLKEKRKATDWVFCHCCSQVSGWRPFGPSLLEIVIYGISCYWPDHGLMPPGTWIVAAGNDLATDLSGLRPVANADLKQRIKGWSEVSRQALPLLPKESVVDTVLRLIVKPKS